MKITALSLLFGSASATMRNNAGAPLQVKSNYDVERQLSGSGDYAVDMADMDDDASQFSPRPRRHHPYLPYRRHNHRIR